MLSWTETVGFLGCAMASAMIGVRSRPLNVHALGLGTLASVASVGMMSIRLANASVCTAWGNQSGLEITIGMWRVSS